ncbi:MAG: replication initiation negative regulator SeqA [Pseudomonadota bacterium]|nr:replication initiation negative regulator SeqA [Pseudomonadota bacterium]
MKSIEIDDDLYAFIASQTKHIGESASQILRRLLLPEDGAVSQGSKPSEASSTPAKTSETKSADVTESTSKPSSAVEAEVESKAPSAKTATKASNASVNRTAAKKAQAKATPAKTAAAKTSAGTKAVKKPAAATEATLSNDTHTKRDILDAVSKDALSTFTKRVDQFLFVLSAAHKLNAENFARVESIKGKNRTYFATSKEALLENGSSTNPKAIPDSPFWVVTNNNTAKKTNMLEQVLRNLGYQPDVIETVVARFSSEGK